VRFVLKRARLIRGQLQMLRHHRLCLCALYGLGTLAIRNVERLRTLRSIAVDSHGLEPKSPGLEISFGDVIERAVVWQVDSLRDGTREEWLRGSHHLDVTHIVIDRVPLDGLKEQSKQARCSGLMPGAPSMVPVASM